MKKLVLFVLAGLVLLGSFLSGCSLNPSGIDPEYAKNFAKEITYIKDERTGLCFAIVASRKTGYVSQNGLGLACVPCEAAQHHLAKQ
jgi:hypothetical protein